MPGTIGAMAAPMPKAERMASGKKPGTIGELQAWDLKTGKLAWSTKFQDQIWTPTFVTGGNLVFWGTPEGFLKAADAKTGKELWKFNTGSGITAGAMTYVIDGKQYVAVVSGRTQSIPAFLGELGEKMVNASPEGGTLFVFALN